MRWLLLLAIVLEPFAARAQGAPGSAPAPAPPPIQTAPAPPAPDYAWQIALADAFGLAAGIAFVQSDMREHVRTPPPRVGGAAAIHWGVATALAPAVHASHRRFGIAAADMTMRVLIPPLAAGLVWPFYCIGADQDRESGGCDNHDGLTIGFVAGSAAVGAFDALVLARAGHLRRQSTPEEWYGWQILLADGAVVAFMAGRAATYEPETGRKLEVAAIPMALGWITPPIIHVAHGEGWRGLGSLGARLFVPPLMALAGGTGYCASTVGVGDDCFETGALGGFFFGSMAVAALDITTAWKPRPNPPDTAGSVTVVPMLELRSSKAFAGVAGRF